MIKNPKWTRDELILVLDFYCRNSPSHISANNPLITKLSNLLRSLPIYPDDSKMATFRNNNSVYLKLCNFLSLDPSYPGKGMSSYSKLDEQIWEEFADDKVYLSSLANAILDGSNFLKQLDSGEKNESKDFYEGKILERIHKYRERNPKIIKIKKEQFFQKYKKLFCEICDFNFESFYGEVATGYIECHHTKPLYQYKSSEKTKLEDLILVCANCHRVLHSNNSLINPEILKDLISQKM